MSNMKTVLLYLITVLFFSCDFARGVRTDAQKQILSHKKFIKEISFTGDIISLENCKDCSFNKYQIIIDLKDLNISEIKLSNQSYPPYYTMNSQNKLSISVSEKLYKEARKGFEIEKKTNSESIFINGKKYELLSKEKYEWIPKVNFEE